MRKAVLTPEQMACVEYSGRSTLLIKGPPGSGKTWVLLLRGHELAAHSQQAGDSVQFVTFTNALAKAAEDMDQDIVRNAAAQGQQAQQAQETQPATAPGWPGIPVFTFHSWCTRLLRRHGVACEVVSDTAQWNMIGRAVAEARKRDYKTASKVRDNHLDWWLDEIKWIKGRLLPNGQLIREFAEYAAVERTGRGSALQAPARQIVWDVYQAYQSQLLASHHADWDDFARLAFDHYLQLSQAADAWHLVIPDRDQTDHVLVDEAQDLQQVQLLLLARAFRKTLTLVADEAQKIYKTTFSFESLGLHFDRGNVRTLDLSFRSTRQILALAYPLLPAAEAAAVQVAPVEGPIPTLYVSPDATQEEAVILHLTATAAHENPDKTVGVLARSWTELDRLKGLLYSRHGLAAELLHKKDGSAFTPGVKLTTFHSAKGLEFDVVILAHLNDGAMPLDPAHYHTEVSAADYEEFLSFERRLLYVAMTRARYLLAMTCSGTPSRFFQELDPAAYEIVDAKVAAPVPAAAPATDH